MARAFKFLILFLVAVAMALPVLAQPAWAQAQTRVALVIANGAYQSVPVLANPAKDGALIVQSLKKAGFQVSELKKDLTKAQFDAALRDFKRAADAADIALVYYAGHGIELEEQNWLLPVDARIADPADALTEGVSLATVLRYVQGARRLRVVVLDACRNNPFAMRLASPTRTVSRGLRPVDGLPADTLVAYSASFGQVAADGQGAENSPFAQALARRLVEPGLEVRFLFASVHDDVIAANAASPIAAIRSQRPWIGSALSSEQVYFVPPVSNGSTATLTVLGANVRASDLGAEVEAFDAAARANDPQVWRTFLAAFPDARLKGVAQQALSSLERPVVAAPGADPLAAVRQALASISAQEWSAAEGSVLVQRVVGASSREALERLAALGDARAQTVAGLAYNGGYSGFEVSTKAGRLIQDAAAQGNARAQEALGSFYFAGAHGLPKDDVQAVRYFRLSAAQGNASGQNSLGAMYDGGVGGLPRDQVEAVRLFRLAAAQGTPGAQANLAIMYHSGAGGLAKDLVEALRLYRLAAAQGNGVGQAGLASMHEYGAGGATLDKAEALRLYRLAARQGNAFAQQQLDRLGESR
ncbi:MAG: caspase family protein [Hyphomonadaceae bacterium]|nr:caspase family protein [Hyphomonadaceae bacterium]